MENYHINIWLKFQVFSDIPIFAFDLHQKKKKQFCQKLDLFKFQFFFNAFLIIVFKIQTISIYLSKIT